MLLRTASVVLSFSVTLMCQIALAQDLAQVAAAARERLYQQRLESSRQLLAPLLEKDDWARETSLVVAMYGMTFSDELVAPLIARTDTISADAHRGVLWHAIAYTRTGSGERFLTQRLKAPAADERVLAKACLAAAQLRERGAQCDLTEAGVVARVFFPFHDRQLTAEDMALVARLPAVDSLSIGNLADGALEPLRSVRTLRYLSLGCSAPYVDEAIGCLRASKELSVLNLHGPVTDAAMPDIGAFNSLTCLRLNDSQITDKGLQHLERLTALSMLELANTAVTDAGLKHLKGLHEMVHLTLTGTAVSGQGLAHLRRMNKLWALNLDGTKIDDRGLGNFEEFEALRNVRFLYLENTKITDAGLAHLAAMKTAEGFSLSGNEQITSAGIERLKGLSELKWVNCAGGRVSHAAAEQFARGRPASFYLSYTTAPGSPIRYEKGHELVAVTARSQLLKKLRRPDSGGHVAQSVIDEIAQQGPTIVPALLDAVKEQHGIYQDVAKVFHKLGPTILDTLVEALRKDNDYRIHSAVTWTFGLHGMPLLPRLRTWLTDESANVRDAASQAMDRLLSHAGVKLPDGLEVDLLRALNDTNINVRQHAAGMLYRLPNKIDKTAAALTKTARSDANESVRMQAVATLGHCAERLDRTDRILRGAVDTLTEAVQKDDSFYVREVSIHYLQRLAAKDDRAVRALVWATGDERESTREKAIDALRELGHESLIKK